VWIFHAGGHSFHQGRNRVIISARENLHWIARGAGCIVLQDEIAGNVICFACLWLESGR
jgi:hypothetical protein